VSDAAAVDAAVAGATYITGQSIAVDGGMWFS